MVKRVVGLLILVVMVMACPLFGAYWRLGTVNDISAVEFGETGEVVIGDGVGQVWYWSGANGIGFGPGVNMTPEQDSEQLIANSIAQAGRWGMNFGFDRAISRFRFVTPLCSGVDLSGGDLVVSYLAGDMEEAVEIFRFGADSDGYEAGGRIEPVVLDWVEFAEPISELSIKFEFNGYIGSMQFYAGVDDGGVIEYEVAVLPLEEMVEVALVPEASRLANAYYVYTPPKLILSLGPRPGDELEPRLKIWDVGREELAGECVLTKVGRRWFADLPSLQTGVYDAVLELAEIDEDVTLDRFALIHPPRVLTWEQTQESRFGMTYMTVDGRFRQSADLNGPALSQMIGLHQVRGGYGSWVGLCPEPGVYNVASASEMQELANRAYELGLVYHNSVAWTPGWANDNRGIHVPPRSEYLPMYREFGRRLAAARKGFAQAQFEVWNEPNCEPYGSFKGTLAEFIAMCHAVSDGVLEGDPDAQMILGSTGGCCAGFIARLLDAGLSEKFEIIDIHPYRHSDQGPEDGLLADINRLRRVIELYGDDQEIMFSEIGWATHVETHAMYAPVTQDQQANYFSRTLLISLAADIKQIHFHMFQDWGLNRREAEHNFGIVTTDGWPKPSLAAMSNTHRHLEQVEFIGTTEQAGGHFAWLWDTPWVDDAKLLTVWTDNPMVSGEHEWIDLPCEPISVEDLWGGEPGVERLRNDNGQWQVLPDADPMFVYLPEASAAEIATSALPGRLRSRVVRETTAEAVENEIAIDGDLAEWGELGNAIDTDRGRGAGSMGYAGIEEGFAVEQSNVTRFACRYDSDGMYFAVQVVDDAPMQNNHSDWWIWAGDCVRVYVGTVSSEEYPFMSEDHVQFGLAPVTNGDGPAQAVNIGEETRDGILSGGVIPNARLTAEQTVDGWTMEAFIPFEYFGASGRAGDTWSFDIEAGGHVWNGGPDNWNNPTRWGEITFE